MREWGDGDRTAVLVHGLTGSADVWAAVGPGLADRGFHVYAVELPGHGEQASPATFSAAALARAVVDQAPHAPDLALGHSLGGYILAAALPALAPRAAVFEDPVMGFSGMPGVLEGYRAQKGWSIDDVRAAYPLWTEEARQHKWEALQRWDPAIIDAFPDATLFPPAEIAAASDVVPMCLFVLADPSMLVPPARAEELRRRGHTVVTVAGAGHSVHHDRLDGFLEALAPVL